MYIPKFIEITQILLFFFMGKKRKIDLEHFLGNWDCSTKAYNGKIKKPQTKKSFPQEIRLKQGGEI